MNTQELPLFNTREVISELESTKSKNTPYAVSSPYTSLDNALSSIFPQQSEENKVTRTKQLLGETAQTLSDEQIEAITTEFQYLIDTWLDGFEKEVFGGMTLHKLLQGK